MQDIAGSLEDQGFALIPEIASSQEITALKTLFENADVARAERGGQTYGARNILELSEVRQFAASTKLREQLRAILSGDFRVVRGIFFDKTESANWPVLWHQDLSLAVKERRDMPGWTVWSVKRGVPHVQAPADALARMVTVRLHLDDCTSENGPLRVVAGSHRQGQLSRDSIRALTEDEGQIVTAKAGDALFMRPLILHASSSAKTPHHRRVLHLEFSPIDLLPPGLEWAEAC